mmetsp:Transcript_54217/g.62083  ORF Transcript_54217/g.62083 Transcript_54217/m.62083 type:complete len:368 (-) Transcript_54217:1127-2230(-)
MEDINQESRFISDCFQSSSDSVDEFFSSYGNDQSADSLEISLKEECLNDEKSSHGLVCDFDGCNKVFPSKWKLYQHHRVHTGERPFVCELCSKAFKIKDALNRHRHTHSKDKPYKCTFQGCTKSFSTSHNLKYHLATHSDKKPFACDYPGCEKSFHTKSQLNQHMRTKTIHQKIDLERSQTVSATSTPTPLISIANSNISNSPASSSLKKAKRVLNKSKTGGNSTKANLQVSIVKHISKETQRQAQKIKELEGYIKMMQQALSVNNISLPSTSSAASDEEFLEDWQTPSVDNLSTDNSDHENVTGCGMSTPSTETGSIHFNFEDAQDPFSLAPDSSSVFDSITPLEVNDNATQFESVFDFVPQFDQC